MQKLKVLLVAEHFWPTVVGGGEISSFLLAKGLTKKGIDVSVLTSRSNEEKKIEVIGNVKIYRVVKSGNTNTLAGNLTRLSFKAELDKALEHHLSRNEIDIVHAMSAMCIPSVAKLQSVTKICHVNSPVAFCPKGNLIRYSKECQLKCTPSYFLPCHMTSEEIGRMKNMVWIRFNPIVWKIIWDRWKAIRNALPKFDHYTPISTFMRDWLLCYGISSEKITVLPNIVEIERFSNLKQMKNKVPKILYIGAYLRSKGVHVLLQALKNIQLHYEASFYGSGNLKEWMQNFVEENKMPVRINNECDYSDLPRVYSEHDIVVFPSLVPEGLGRVALEAAAAGKAIVASRVGGIVDVVENGKTGLLVEAGNVEELSRAINLLLSNKSLCAKFGKAGLAKAKREYSEKAVVGKAIKIYKKVKNESLNARNIRL
ncbi:MAG: glycosyltransferase family 4 protein [Candidatus Woesearchaeota archaeon]